MSARLTTVVRSAYRTWGWRGLARRAAHEVGRRTGQAARREERWRRAAAGGHQTLVALPIAHAVAAPTLTDGATARLYGHFDVPVLGSDVWSRHPVTGHCHALAHWTSLHEGGLTGDIKDLWELGRLSWLLPRLGTDAAAESCWMLIESFAAANPPYRGPQWMCGQESALRGIVLAVAAAATSSTPASTPERRQLVADLLTATVGRVRPTLRYALSQRNNHAVSEAAFLWAVPILVDGLPEAEGIRRAGARALREVVSDQWYADGAYAQHAPTYQRLALHALLFVLAVGRTTGEPSPPGVEDVVARSARFLTRLADPATGAVPNLGGNDGALLFDLAGRPIGDFRPVIVHAAAATGGRSPYEPGPWDDEAIAFGLEVGHQPSPARSDSDGISHHIHVGPASRSLLRAGPLRHRPAHADQLHVDVWIQGTNVTPDAGSYRYTAPHPWGNGLAEEDVHCVPRSPGRPQAERRGRFYWMRWSDATVVARHRSAGIDLTLVELRLTPAHTLRRVLARIGDCHLVLDRTPPGSCIRWNLPDGTLLTLEDGTTTASGSGWQATFTHAGRASVRVPTPDDPGSGWISPTYGRLERAVALELSADGSASACFGPHGHDLVVPGWLGSVLEVDDDRQLVRLLPC